jgi:hypothetical protein
VACRIPRYVNCFHSCVGEVDKLNFAFASAFVGIAGHWIG